MDPQHRIPLPAEQAAAAGGDDDDDHDAGVDSVELLRQIAERAAERIQYGQRLSREEHKAIEKLAYFQLAETHWPNRAACADALGITPKALERRIADGCPVPAHAPIAKEPVYQFEIGLLRTQGGKPADDADPVKQRDVEEARWRRLKNDQLEGTMVAEAESEAMAALARVARAVKQRLVWAAPEQLVDLVMGSADRAAAVAAVRDYQKQALTEMARAAGALEGLDDVPQGTPAEGGEAR